MLHLGRTIIGHFARYTQQYGGKYRLRLVCFNDVSWIFYSSKATQQNPGLSIGLGSATIPGTGNIQACASLP